MKVAAEAFVDTNVLVCALDVDSRLYEHARRVLSSTHRTYAISPQVLFEFLSVITSPRNVRFPLATEQAHEVLRVIIARPNLLLLPIDSPALTKGLALTSKHDLRGPRVFDALIAGVMLRHHIPVIITANVKDFQSLGVATEPL